MMPGVRYLPMLRSKAGEAAALAHLTSPMKDHVVPVFHLTQFLPATFAAAVTSAWNGRSMALDGKFLCDMTGSTRDFAYIFDQIGRGRVALIPSIECHAFSDYLTAVQVLRGRYAPGVLVKARPSQLYEVTAWCGAQGWPLDQIDLVVNLGDISGFDPAALASVVRQGILDHVPNPSSWRSLALAASAAPRDESGLLPGRNIVPRTEWTVWRAVAAAIPQSLDYADFSTAHPDLSDPPGFAITRSLVSVRYTACDEWIILRGSSVADDAANRMSTQYRAHAMTLVADAKFGGLRNCWADDQIRKIAQGAPGGGSRSVWAAIVASRHLSFVAHRIVHSVQPAAWPVALAAFALLACANEPPAFGRAGGFSRDYWSETRILNLPPEVRAGIQRITTSCERPLAARSSFDRYLQDRSGDQFVALHFEDLRCDHQAVCTASGCLKQIYMSNGGRYRLVWSGYVADIELREIGPVAGVNVACSAAQPGCSKLLRWNGSHFAGPRTEH